MRQTFATSRAVLLGALCAVALGYPAAAQTGAPRRHVISKLGDAKYPAGYTSFDWVNPAAPKGGHVRVAATGSFDNLNPFTIKGSTAPALGLTDATLFAASLDEPATAYAFVAEWVSYPADYASATFGLRAAARFADGSPITPDDVIFSFEEQKRASPSVAIYYRDVTAALKSGDREVTFRFAKAGNRDLPYLVSLLSIIPKAFWQAKGASGEPRDLANTTLEPPVSPGPYRIKSVDTGRSIVYERVTDWWAKDLPVNAGQYNFDEIRYTMYRDDLPQFEALKAGDIDLAEENSSKRWATGYDTTAVRDGRLKKVVLEKKTVADLQGFLLNQRRAKFTDLRVRRAFALAYDFESANASLFYGLYKRINSVFENSELAHQGLPVGRELAILEPYRDKLPPEVFTTPYKAPVNANGDDFRRNLREAARLLAEAGWKLDKGQLRQAVTGEALTAEFLNYDTSFDRIVLPYKQNLEKLGIRLDIRIVDATLYEKRVKTFDFDMITDANVMSYAPGNELREFWGSAAASKEASRNRAGIQNPVVDAIIEDVIYARDRPELIAAARALDRVILWSQYIIPQWYNPNAWVAYWDKFGRPAKHPSQDPGVLTTWWYDAAAAGKLEASNARK